MPTFRNGDAEIYYEVHGEGFPVLALAPGGLRSFLEKWRQMPWDPIAKLQDSYQVIAMDQRNAGAGSTAPISGADGWATYCGDQLALLDHLGVERCHVVGMCIGGSFIMEIAKTAPERMVSAVMLQPIGLDGNREVFMDLFNGWAAERKPEHRDVPEADWASFRANLFAGDGFMFNAGDAEVSACTTPILVLMGNDAYHPEATSRRVAKLAPNATLIEKWKEDEFLPGTDKAIKAFLAAQG